MKIKLDLLYINCHHCTHDPFSKDKSHPRPLFYENLLNYRKSRQKFRVKGHKFFAKLSASGPGTAKTLNEIQQSRCVKAVQSFEFDP